MKELIRKIEKRPVMYLTSHSINYLRAYLNGVLYGMPKQVSLDSCQVMDAFQVFIQNKYEVRTSQGWHQIILFYSCNEADALDKFFELFGEFSAK